MNLFYNDPKTSKIALPVIFMVIQWLGGDSYYGNMISSDSYYGELWWYRQQLDW